MRQLSGLDASFLALETPQMPMHVGALHLFELPPDYRGDFVADMRAHMAARLPLAGALRRKLATLPMNLAAPAWVDAAPDLEQHIVRVKLRRGSDLAALEAKVGELHPVLLPRDRPLWKFHVFEGLANGPQKQRRYAMYTQLHHAAVDGQAAVALAQAVLDLSPEPREIPTRPPKAKRPEPGLVDLLRGALANQFDQVGRIVKALPAAVGALSQVAASSVGSAFRGEGLTKLGLAPRTRLNATVSATRAFAAVSLPLAGLNAARRRHQASLNDAVLAICSGALRRHFQHHGPLPRKSLVAAVPISLREKGDTAANNQASMSLISLGTHLADPAQRLAHVMAATASMKATLGNVKNVLPTDFPTLGVPWLMQGLTALYGRFGAADKIPPLANLTISNVPGPTVPLYMAGAKMTGNYPTSIVVHGVALNITVQTYDQSLDFGLIACAEALPDVAELAMHLREACAEFEALPATVMPMPQGSAPPAAATVKPSAKKPSATKAAKTGTKAAAPEKSTPAAATKARTTRARAPVARRASR